MKGHTGFVLGLVVVANKIYSASGDKTIRCWDCTSYEEIAVLKGHTAQVSCLAAGLARVPKWKGALGGRLCGVIASGGHDNVVRLWNANENCELRGPLKGHTGGVRAVACTQGTLASGSADLTIRLWSTADYTLTGVLEGHTGFIYCLCIVGGKLFSGGCDKTVLLTTTPPHR